MFSILNISTLIFKGEKMKFDDKRTFGVEIEFISQNNQRITNEEINQYLSNHGANFRIHQDIEQMVKVRGVK